MHFVPEKGKILIFHCFKGKNCATHPARAADSFGMPICIRCRQLNLGRKGQTNKKKQEKEKASKKEKRKKRKKEKKKKKKKKERINPWGVLKHPGASGNQALLKAALKRL